VFVQNNLKLRFVLHYKLPIVPNLTASRNKPKAKRKQSRFQKLTVKADRLKRQNERLKSRLDELLEFADQKIRPLEKEAAEADLPLLRKLLTLGQRKSMTQWQRGVLDDWIRELVTDMQIHGVSDDALMDDVARYDAFRMGVQLQEEDGVDSPYEQMSSLMQKLEREAEERKREQQESQVDDLKTSIDEFIEKELDKQLGPPPALPANHERTFDLLQDELDTELELKLAEYRSRREALREELLAELKAESVEDFGADLFEDILDGNFSGFGPDGEAADDFGSADPYEGFNEDDESWGNDTPAINNETFHRMFRLTAAKLHPDREPDPSMRAEKQRLMVLLLSARKKGDLLTVLQMYQEHTDNTESFSAADEKQLIDALEYHIECLELEKDELIFQSPLHFSIHNRFYHSNRKKQSKKIDDHIKMIKSNMRHSEKMTHTIKSLKTLKPWLEARYDQAFSMHGELDQMLEEMDLRNCPF